MLLLLLHPDIIDMSNFHKGQGNTACNNESTKSTLWEEIIILYQLNIIPRAYYNNINKIVQLDILFIGSC